jgi:hypothetical protein
MGTLEKRVAELEDAQRGGQGGGSGFSYEKVHVKKEKS